MFLDSIILTQTLPCLAEPGKVIIIGKPSSSVNDVLPYLATLPGVIIYNPAAGALTFRRNPGFLSIFSDKVVITQVRDVDQGLELLSALKEAINTVWEQRNSLTPMTSRRTAARPLDVWLLLPQTNCGKCSEVTCLAFAFLLIQGKKKVTECPSLELDPAFANQRITIETIL